MFRSIASLALVLCSMTAIMAAERSEVVFPDGAVVEVTVDRMEAVARFTAGEGQVTLPSAYLPSEYGRDGNSVLFLLSEGASGCPGYFAWLTHDEGGLSATEAFGTCSDTVEIEQAEGGVMVSMPRMAGSGRSGFVFDGDTVTEIDLGLESAGVSDPEDAAAWAGIAAVHVLGSSELEAALLGIMSWQELENVRASSVVMEEGMSEDGEWYAATGCRPRMCSEESAGVAISKLDGRVIAAYWTATDGGKLYGKPDSPLPTKLRALLSSGEPL